MLCLVFFFSSRRRHTRYWRDWSSDVCSSDLLRSSSRATTTHSSCASVCATTQSRASRTAIRASCSLTATAPRWCSSKRSEEHTSELQSRQYLVCRLLLEKKKSKHNKTLTR